MLPFQHVAPYDVMAIGLFPYNEIASHFQQQIQHHRPGSHTLLDIACGSGNLTLPLARLGYQITGLDRSAKMLAAARHKAATAGLTITFVHGEMQQPYPVRPVDAVTCFYGGLNFLLEPEAVRLCFQAVYKVLLPGGLFLFDQFGEAKMRAAFQGIKTADFDTFYVITDSLCNTTGYVTHTVTYFLKEADGRYRRVEELQLMRIYPFDHLKSWLTEAGFEHLATTPIYPNVASKTLEEVFLFLARKP